jgi:hypothetical protein
MDENLNVSPHGSNTMLNAVPVRIQRSRKTKQVSPNGLPIVYVGRPTKWGNPFRVVKLSDGFWSVKTDTKQRNINILIENCRPAYKKKEDAISDAVKCYQITLVKHLSAYFDLKELTGKNLSCWCPINCQCHADILLEMSAWHSI